MSLAETAPLLHTYWPILAGALVGVLVNIVLKSLQGGGGGGGGGKARGRPEDEDNHVFQDTIGREMQTPIPQDDYATPEEEDEGSHIPYKAVTYPEEQMIRRSREFYEEMNARRSVRFFSDKPVPREVLDNIIRTAGTSPSGAHTEPWTFVAVSDPEIKAELRSIIEDEERINYERRMGEKWVTDLKPLGTSWSKPYLEIAPYILVVFRSTHTLTEDGKRKTNYYSEISISIAVGLLLAAIQHAGLVSLTSTPMNAGPRMRILLDRPSNEKVILLLPLGYAAENATVPDFKRKPLEDIIKVV